MWKPLRNLRPVCIGAVALLPHAGQAAATVAIFSPPAVITPGQVAQVNVQFSKSAGEPEKRFVVRVDLHDADTDEKVSGGIQDNSKAGFTGNTGNVFCAVPVPANASGAYYFKAWVAPWSLNKAIVAHYKTYPTDGTFTYLWGGGGYGVTQNVYYRGSLICPKPSGNTTYCSGLAFEACIIPFNAYNAIYGHQYIGNITNYTQMENFRKIWYGVTIPGAELKLAADAIPMWGAGREITDFEEAQEGDFIQLWRHSGSGHNPMFVSWRRNSSGTITGVNYWGSQGSSNGIGYSGENFGTTSGMDRNKFYIGRVAKRRDQADSAGALGSIDTSANLRVVPSTVGVWLEYQDR